MKWTSVSALLVVACVSTESGNPEAPGMFDETPPGGTMPTSSVAPVPRPPIGPPSTGSSPSATTTVPPSPPASGIPTAQPTGVPDTMPCEFSALASAGQDAAMPTVVVYRCGLQGPSVECECGVDPMMSAGPWGELSEIRCEEALLEHCGVALSEEGESKQGACDASAGGCTSEP